MLFVAAKVSHRNLLPEGKTGKDRDYGVAILKGR